MHFQYLGKKGIKQHLSYKIYQNSSSEEQHEILLR